MSTVIATPGRLTWAWLCAFRSSIAIVVFVALWEALPRLGWVDVTFLPPFSVVLRGLYDMTPCRASCGCIC